MLSGKNKRQKKTANTQYKTDYLLLGGGGGWVGGGGWDDLAASLAPSLPLALPFPSLSFLSPLPPLPLPLSPSPPLLSLPPKPTTPAPPAAWAGGARAPRPSPYKTQIKNNKRHKSVCYSAIIKSSKRRVCVIILAKGQGAGQKRSATPVVGGWVRGQKRARVRFILNGVFELPSPGNAQKRGK
jgi:hypothetical protein